MKKLISYILFFSLALFPTYEQINACIDPPNYEEQRYMLFNPDLEENKSWWTYFYNNSFFYMGETVHSSEDEKIIAAEWAKETNTNVSTEEIYRCLFVLDTDSARKTNAFYKEIQKSPAYKQYFDFAFACEYSMGLNYDPWNIEEVRDSLSQVQEALSKKVLVLLDKEKNSFLKKRYAFQALKLSCYFFDMAVFNKVYAQYFSAPPQTPIDWWAMNYKSNVLGMTSQVDSATYLHALVFSNSSSKMLTSRLRYSSKDFSSAYRLTRNNNERADLYVLNETINPGRSLTNLKKIYELDPTHKHLPLLISREINKLEDWLGSTKYVDQYPANRRSYYGDKDFGPLMANWQSDRAYLDQFYALLSEMKEVEKMHPDYYHLSMAYLNTMREKPAEARRQLALVKSTSAQIAFQMNIMKVVLCTQELDIKSEKAQQQIGDLLETLIKTRKAKFESQKALFSLARQLQYCYAKEGMVYYAGLFNYYATELFCYQCQYGSFEYNIVAYYDNYASVKDVERLIKLTDKKNKNSLDLLLLRPFPNNYYFYDILSQKYLRAGDTKNALAAINHIPDSFWEQHINATYYLDDDPFNHVETLLQKKGFSSPNKKEILQQLTDLEKKAQTGSLAERAEANTLLGNAWYNFTDNSWYMLSYYQLPWDDLLIRKANRKASAYYQEALKYETATEKKAKLAYMMLACAEEKEMLKYAKIYEGEYASTKFYNDRGCVYSRTMVNSK